MTRISISKFLATFNIIVLIGLLAVTSAAGFALNSLRIGGETYEQIIASKDIVADILPPPLYVIEAYLEVNLAQNDPKDAEQHASNLKALHTAYDERRAYWQNLNISVEIQRRLTVDSENEAKKFWNEVEQNFLPAVASGDTIVASYSLNRIGAAYREHRKIIDQAVALANTFSAKAEAAADAQKHLFFWIVGGTTVVVFLIMVVAIVFMRSWLIKPLSSLSVYMTKLDDAFLPPTTDCFVQRR